MGYLLYLQICVGLVTVQWVCALAALTVIKHRLEGKNPIGEADLEWIFARNYEALNSYNIQMIRMRRGSGRSCGNSAAGIYHARKGMV